ncbi:hypothetical protein EVAR_25189_1 [Eumeta japonica]|uniref:Uncharacterized protein n=1 Tax=Eumeta variegata TaxID=151549 RepID=A0A4C1WJ19_EUMVA|nr:hypothetical protein EVAR_25189_1 [Eumeta japonica]
MVETDKRVAYQEFQTSLSNGKSQVLKILHEHLAVEKLCTRNRISDLGKSGLLEGEVGRRMPEQRGGRGVEGALSILFIGEHRRASRYPRPQRDIETDDDAHRDNL